MQILGIEFDIFIFCIIKHFYDSKLIVNIPIDIIIFVSNI